MTKVTGKIQLKNMGSPNSLLKKIVFNGWSFGAYLLPFFVNLKSEAGTKYIFEMSRYCVILFPPKKELKIMK